MERTPTEAGGGEALGPTEAAAVRTIVFYVAQTEGGSLPEPSLPTVFTSDDRDLF